MNESSHPTCDTCAYFGPIQPGQGECRRHAPQPNSVIFVSRTESTGSYKNDVHWPKVYDSNWCGEYKAKA